MVDFMKVRILLRNVRNCRRSGVAITTDAKVWKNEIGCKCPQHVTDRKRGTRESTQPVRDGSAGEPAENYGNIPPLWSGVRPRALLAVDGVNRRKHRSPMAGEAAACWLRDVAQHYAFLPRHCVTCVTQSGQIFVPLRCALPRSRAARGKGYRSGTETHGECGAVRRWGVEWSRDAGKRIRGFPRGAASPDGW